MSIQPVLQNIYKQINQQRRELDHLNRRVVFSPIHAANAKEYTIDSGAIDVTRPNALLHPESGTEDDLDTINNAVDGKTVILRTADASYTITVLHDAGNIFLFGANNDRVLDDPHDSLWLIYNESTSRWEELAPKTLDQLNKVIISNPQDGEVLTYDAANEDWKNLPIPGLLFSQTNDQTVADTVTETTLFSTGEGNTSLDANELEVGTTIRLSLSGHLSNTGSPTLNIKVTLGGTEVCSTGANSLDTDVAEVDWRVHVLITCRSVGASGVVVATGFFSHNGGSEFGMVKTTSTTVDTTSALAIDVTATWGTADAANTITTQEDTIEKMIVS